MDGAVLFSLGGIFFILLRVNLPVISSELIFAFDLTVTGKTWNDLATGQLPGTDYVVGYKSSADAEAVTMLILGSGLVGLVAFRKGFQKA